MNLDRRSELLAPLYLELDAIRRQISNLANTGSNTEQHEHTVAQLSIDGQSLESEIARRRYSLPQYMPATVETILPENVVLIDFYQYDSAERFSSKTHKPAHHQRLAVYVVRTNGPIVHLDLGPIDPVKKAITSWRANILRNGGAIRGDRRHRPNATLGETITLPQQTLRGLIWTPLDKYLKKDETVLVSPDGVLASVPFGALPARNSGKYLIEERPIAIAPVPRLIQRLNKVLKHKQLCAKPEGNSIEMLLIGDVDFNQTSVATDPRGKPSGFSFSPLPGTKKEIKAIKELFQSSHRSNQTLVLSGANATEYAFRNSVINRRYLHLATHGFFRDSDRDPTLGDLPSVEPMSRSHPGVHTGLALSGANIFKLSKAHDGILTAFEVASLDLNNTELAVLSACETGLGKSFVGEGVLGLQRAFQVAGCNSTITSLWRVHDEATQALMAEFYQNFWIRKYGKLESLRQAQLAMLRGELFTPDNLEHLGQQYLPPSYWAAFQLSGDWQ